MNDNPLHDMMMPEAWYQDLDAGIRLAVRVLHAAGIETCQSCQGGPGHPRDLPSVDMVANGEDAIGFRALAALADYGLKVADVAIVWNIRNFLPYEKLWRVTFVRTMEARADEIPLFVSSYRATPAAASAEPPVWRGSEGYCSIR